VAPVHGLDGGEHRIEALLDHVVVTGDPEFHESGLAVLRGDGLLDVAHARLLRDGRAQVANGVLRRRLHEHGLARVLLGEPVGVGPLGLARFTDVLVLVGDFVDAHAAADHEGDDHERQPPEESLLAVLGAPAAHASREICMCGGGGIHAASMDWHGRRSNSACMCLRVRLSEPG
jgi:hypothetical protein